MRPWLLLLVAGCNTQPLSTSDLGAVDLAKGVDLVAACDAASMSFGPPTPGAITCATSSCSSPQLCCLVAGSSNMGSCQSGCPPSLSSFTCDGPDDCNGGRCCLTANGTQLTASCAASCGQLSLCHATGDCPAGQECASRAGVPTGSGVCVPPTCL